MRLILAISGGTDSVVLLDALAKDRLTELTGKIPSNPPLKKKVSPPQTNGEIFLAYFDHGTPHGKKAEQFVQKLAAKYALPLHTGRAKGKLTSEAAFREARYKFFYDLKNKLKTDWIVTAHHADDQAETILLNLVRGSGLAGLAGMPEYRCDIWRPLINTPKSELEKYAKKHRLEHITDPTNRNPKYARNRVRTKVLPELEQINPRVRAALLRASEQARETHEYLRQSAKQWLRGNAKNSALSLQKFTQLGNALAVAILREIYLVEVGHLRQLEEKHFAEILQLAANPAGNKQKKLGQLTFKTGKRGGTRVLVWNN